MAADHDSEETTSSRLPGDEDIFEDVLYLDDERCDTNHVSAALLLKMKLLIDLRNIRILRKVVPASLPIEIVAGIGRAII